MLLTEEAAERKRCPHITYDSETKWDGSIIRKPNNCINSKCMAWRWKNDNKVVGYCGLAGKPFTL